MLVTVCRARTSPPATASTSVRSVSSAGSSTDSIVAPRASTVTDTGPNAVDQAAGC